MKLERALLIANSRSAQCDEKVEAAKSWFQREGIALRVCKSASPEHARDALRAHAAEVDCVLVLGGDGTLHHLLPALLECGLPLGLLPAGTANDFARSLDLPVALEQALAVIVDGQRRDVDVALAGDTPFLNAAHVGLGADAAMAAPTGHKRALGVLAYLGRALERLGERRSFRAEIVCDGQTRRLRSVQVTAGNAPFYGGGNMIHPDATPDDGLLHLYSVRPAPTARLIFTALLLRRGRGEEAAGVDRMSGREIRIGTSRPMAVTADGEAAGRTPVVLRLRPRALPVIVARGQRHGYLLGDEQVALREAAQSLRNSAGGYAMAADLAEDPAIAARFRDTGARRGGMAEGVEAFVRELGAVPDPPDADREAFSHLFERLKRTLAQDKDRVLLESQLSRDRDAEEALLRTLSLGLPERILATLGELRAEVAEDFEGLLREELSRGPGEGSG